MREPSTQEEDQGSRRSLQESLDANTPRLDESPGTIKGAEALARQIEREVVAAGWPVGHPIGTEPELIQRFGVSRAVIREAIRILEHHMVARMRPGPHGGLIITEPEFSMVSRAAALYLDYRRVQPEHLDNARSALEVKCLALAMERLTETGRSELTRVIEAEADYNPAEMIAYSDEFHITLARLTDDPALELFLGVLLQLTGDHALPPEEGAIQLGDKVYSSRDAHAAIGHAILALDGELATALLLEHLHWVTVGLEGRQ
jgi:DNA-binding FadR family transcriptional regulator